MSENETVEKQLKQARAKDSTDGARTDAFMTLDAWNQDGNPTAIVDEFGPELQQEAPPTLNGKPT
ncbi:hypothetical protein FE782_18850 [Paenibacillus antri]|uniref:Uncharacterized protein n=1 Tax=Paenibacillus antri TaxID=2582848 RepID=A0A5R9GBK2_9BACL|nr:hypothetical protein [Paenibacillus antri]TLS50758.1 hypothetical protein FE782_18850 [Paenibacillus antri]